MPYPPRRFFVPRLVLIAGLINVLVSPSLRAQTAGEETLIEMKAIAGLRFDLPRFRVAPGTKVRLVLENTDDMAHNLLIVAPGARTEVVTAAMTMPVTPTQDFVPKTEKVLWAIPVLTPGKKAEVSFTAPAQEGVYPYVCSYPGHGFVMYGAMYVSKADGLPPLEKDPHVPDLAKENASKSLHAFEQKPPYLYRTFVRDSGPASIAVALPNQQNYVWDAGACRLRYAWAGAFLNPLPHWTGNGDAFAEVKGRIYWRAPEPAAPAGSFLAEQGLVDERPGSAFPLRFGAATRVPGRVKFSGYSLVDRYPEFRYEVDGVAVRELIKPQHHGGLEQTFFIEKTSEPVFYVTDPEGGATFSADVGEFKSGVLEVSAEQARRFTVKISEITGREPLVYWSMNDTLSDKKPLPVRGVKGRAIVFDGKKSKFATGVKTDLLSGGATIAFWAKLAKADGKEQPLVSATAGADEFVLGYGISGSGLGFLARSGGATAEWHAEQAPDTAWHHVALVHSADGVALLIDGQAAGSTGPIKLPAGAELVLGLRGAKTFSSASLDEFRIFDRVLTPADVKKIYDRERVSLSPQP